MGGATLAAAIAGTTGGAGAGVFDFSSGSGTITIPAAPTGVTIEVWGGGGGGGYGTRSPTDLEPIEFPGGGGGSGAYSKTILVLSGADAGKTIAYSVGTAGYAGTFGDPDGGAGGISTAYAGTYALPEMICTGGAGGSSGFAGGDQGAGGTATGGNTTNTPGNGGAFYTLAGGAAIVGVDNLVGGAGGEGGFPIEGGEAGQPGSNGRVRFKFTF